MTSLNSTKSLFSKTTTGMFWIGLGTAGRTLVQFVVLIFLARLLTPSEFGIVAAALVIVGLSSIFSQLGVGPALVQRPQIGRHHVRTAFSLSLGLGILFYTIVFITAPWVELFFQMGGLSEVLRLAALVFPVKGLGIVAESLAQRELRFRLISLSMLASFTFGYGCVGISLAFMGFGPYALVAAHISQATIMTIMLYIWKRHSVVPWIQMDSLKELMYFGSGLTIANLGNYTSNQGDNIVVGRVLGATDLGVYGRAYQIMLIPANLIGSVLEKVLFPAMASFQDDYKRLATTYRRGISVVGLLAAPISAFMIIFASELVNVVLGNQWDAVVPPLQIFAGVILFRTAYKIGDTVARATGAVYRRAWRHWIVAIVTLTAAMAGSYWGIQGVAVGVAAAIILNYFLVANLCHKLSGLGWREFILAHLPGLMGGLICAVIAISIKTVFGTYFSSLLVLIVATFSISIVLIAVWYFLPHLFLGKDGQWFFRRIKKLL